MSKIKTMVIISIVCVIVSVLGNTAYASGNTQVTNYQFNNTASTGSTTYRIKNNDSASYVHPINGLTIFYTIYGGDYSYDSGHNCSAMVSVPVGETLYLTNNVYNNYTYAKLKFDRMIGSPVNINTSGTWSPDSE